MAQFDGGYYMIKAPLIREGLNKHTSCRVDAISDKALRAVNIVQATPWRVNNFILDVLSEAWMAGDQLAGIPAADPMPLPARILEDRWEEMTKADRAKHKYELSKVHGWNAKLQSRRESLIRKLNVSTELRGRAAVWFPHFFDFRGRMYPYPQDLTPQGDDTAKSLLMFSEGKPLGPVGLYWLAQRISACAGQDKLTLEERYQWALDHHDMIIDSARDPLDGHRWWASFEDEEPWSLLATCHEWRMATESENPEAFVSHLSIPLDGSCNGLQHLSMWALDPVGARATNCTSEDKRYDLYTEVADVVRSLCQDDLVGGAELAAAWLAEGITRKTVKRAVMTTPYGVTERGIQDQLISDGHTKGFEDRKVLHAMYMKDKIIDALSATVRSARDMMAYMQECAAVLAAQDKPFCWTTPDGFHVAQAYFNMNPKRVNTIYGRLQLLEEDEALGLDKTKQKMASAPNVIHSYDSSHLRKTVVAAHDSHDIRNFAMIHDSFGTHAADTVMLSAVLRREMHGIYKHPVLDMFHQEMIEQGGPDMPAPPATGSYNVEEVLDAKYFFA